MKTVIFAKKDGSIRFSANCRELDAVTIRDTFTLQERNKCITYLGKAIIISTLDDSGRYWKIKLD